MRRQSFFDPGALDKRVSLQSITETADGCGGVEISWTTEANLWACIRPVQAQADLVAQQSHETINHEIIIRYRDDLVSGWRFILGARTFDILTIRDPDERQRYLVCSTEEVGR